MAGSISSDIARAFAAAVTNPLVAAALGNDSEALGGAWLETPAADRRLLAIIDAYRADPGRWAPVLLEALAPMLVPRIGRLSGEPPVISVRDATQQLVTEVLEAAASMPFSEDSQHVAKDLVKRAAWMVTRQLRRERRIQRFFDPLPEEDDEDEKEGDC